MNSCNSFVLLLLMTSCSLFDGDGIERIDQYSGNYIAYTAKNVNVLDKIDFVVDSFVEVDTTDVISSDLRLVINDDDTYGFRTSSTDVASFILKHAREFENNINGREKVLAFDCEDEFTSFCDFQNLGAVDVRDMRRVDVPFNVTEVYSWILRIDGSMIHLRYERNTDPDNVIGPNDLYVQEFIGRLVTE